MADCLPVSSEPRYLEEVAVGQPFERAGRTVTDAALELYPVVSGDYEESHTTDG